MPRFYDKLTGLLLLLSGSTFMGCANATVSMATTYVHGLGGASTPTVSVTDQVKIGVPIRVTAQSADPDDDPIQYRYRWCWKEESTLSTGRRVENDSCSPYEDLVSGQVTLALDDIFSQSVDKQVTLQVQATNFDAYPSEQQLSLASQNHLELYSRHDNGSAPHISDLRIGPGSQHAVRLAMGHTIFAEYTYSDPDNDPQGETYFEWLRNDVVIREGINLNSYTIADDDTNTHITVRVTPKANAGFPSSGASVTSSRLYIPQASQLYAYGILSNGKRYLRPIALGEGSGSSSKHRSFCNSLNSSTDYDNQSTWARPGLADLQFLYHATVNATGVVRGTYRTDDDTKAYNMRPGANYEWSRQHFSTTEFAILCVAN